MKLLKYLFVLPIACFSLLTGHAQNTSPDSSTVIVLIEKGKEYFSEKKYDSAQVCFQNASLYYEKLGQWRNFLNCETKRADCFRKSRQANQTIETLKSATEKCLAHIGKEDTLFADAYHLLGKTYYNESKNNLALQYWDTTLRLRLKIYGKIHTAVAKSYNNIGIAYYARCKYDSTLHYYQKALRIEKEINGDNHPSLAAYYVNLAALYDEIGDSKKALECNLKALPGLIAMLGEKHFYVATIYNNMGQVYWGKRQCELSLEYYFKSLNIFKEHYPSKTTNRAKLYENIAIVYSHIGENKLALDYYQKSHKLRSETLSEGHVQIATSHNTLGKFFYDMGEYQTALYHYQTAYEMAKRHFGKNHKEVAKSLIYIGTVHEKTGKHQLPSDNYFEALLIRRELYGEKSMPTAWSYKAIADLCLRQKDYNKAFRYYQKGIVASVANFNDTVNLLAIPNAEGCHNWDVLLGMLKAKAGVLANHQNGLSGFENLSQAKSLEIVLQHYCACDTLIGKVRTGTMVKSDKLRLGKLASEIYGQAIDVCLRLVALSETDNIWHYKELTFNFAEKNKASVLLESLANADAQKFSNIPDSMLNTEHELRTKIARFGETLAQASDSTAKTITRNKLFDANRQYEKLIGVFENDYPKYYELKHAQQLASVNDIQHLLDPNQAMLSYFSSKNKIIRFTLTSEKFDITSIPIESNFDTTIANFCYYGLAYKANPYRFEKVYERTAFELYQKLIPKNIDNGIDRLIIIPDSKLNKIPFEALLSEKTENNTWKTMPYLICKFAMSYAYSGTLFCRSTKKEENKQDNPDALNDWLALAPVFDNTYTAGATWRTQGMFQNKVYPSIPDSANSRGIILNGKKILELPFTKNEVKTIYGEFENHDLRATLKINQQANETFVKSGDLANYKYIHFATHGFVDPSRPELSGILLAQDTISPEDCILRTGEMYNLELNSNLVVLSACETALGNILEGEGVMGLSRALLYAGTKGLLVSLWEIADESTSELMVAFYKNLLEDYHKNDYPNYLRQAKMQMIASEKYSHPYYWSSFILIGR